MLIKNITLAMEEMKDFYNYHQITKILNGQSAKVNFFKDIKLNVLFNLKFR